MSFETFDRSLHGNLRSPKITLQRSGVLSINAGALKKLDDPESVVLLYDKENGVIGLKSDGSDKAFPLHKSGSKESGQKTASIRSFLNYYGIKHERTLMFHPKLSEDGILCITLSEGKQTARGDVNGTGDGR